MSVEPDSYQIESILSEIPLNSQTGIVVAGIEMTASPLHAIGRVEGLVGLLEKFYKDDRLGEIEFIQLSGGYTGKGEDGELLGLSEAEFMYLILDRLSNKPDNLAFELTGLQSPSENTNTSGMRYGYLSLRNHNIIVLLDEEATSTRANFAKTPELISTAKDPLKGDFNVILVTGTSRPSSSRAISELRGNLKRAMKNRFTDVDDMDEVDSMDEYDPNAMEHVQIHMYQEHAETPYSDMNMGITERMKSNRKFDAYILGTLSKLGFGQAMDSVSKGRTLPKQHS